MAHLDDRLDDGPVDPAGVVDTVDERSVDLHGVDGEVLEVLERRPVRPHVVHGELDAQPGDGPEVRGGSVVGQRGLGDLDGQAVGVETGLLQGDGGGGGGLVAPELEDRAVDRQLDLRAPPDRLGAGFGQHPRVQGRHVAVDLGPRDQLFGRDPALDGVVPPQEGLEAEQAARGQVDGGLEEQFRFTLYAQVRPRNDRRFLGGHCHFRYID